jgi:hypothetical protein
VQRITVYAASLFFVLAYSVAASSGSTAVSGKQGLEMLKTLAGKWKGTMITKDGPVASVEYQITSGGTAVIEKLFPGTSDEMATVYYLDGDDLVATHYFSAGNQPSMKLNAQASDARKLVFDFVRVNGLKKPNESHIRDVTISLVEGNRLESLWRSSSKGEDLKLFMSRAK